MEQRFVIFGLFGGALVRVLHPAVWSRDLLLAATAFVVAASLLLVLLIKILRESTGLPREITVEVLWRRLSSHAMSRLAFGLSATLALLVLVTLVVGALAGATAAHFLLSSHNA